MTSLLALVLPIGGTLAVAPVAQQGSYQLGLTSREPTVVHFEMNLPREQAVSLTLSKEAELPNSAPQCGSTPLRQTVPRTWVKPAGCAVVHWSGSMANGASADFDASSPISVWIDRDRTWLLTGSLPWLEAPGQDGLPVQINAQVGSKKFSVRARGPAAGEIPVYIPVGDPSAHFKADGFTVVGYGAVPAGAEFDKLELRLAATLARWWTDIPPPDTVRPDHFNFVWFGPSRRSAPGVFASAGSDALLIQYVPDRKATNSDAKLKAAIFGVGAHEALHSLFESVPGFGKQWATWAAESLPTYFAYQAARRHLRGPSLAMLRSEIINAPANQALLPIEAKTDAGEQSQYDKFYGRGARFWWAIENVLTNPPNGSGRLAALIRRTNGMQGMDWRNAESIAAYLDRYSGGRAGPIVQCFLADDNCPLANRPIP